MKRPVGRPKKEDALADITPTVILKPKVQHDDHVKARELIMWAKSRFLSPAQFARAQCAAWGVNIDDLRASRGSGDVPLLRYILINRLKAAYPHLTATQIGKIIHKTHSTVLFTLGELEWKKPAPMGAKYQQ